MTTTNNIDIEKFYIDGTHTVFMVESAPDLWTLSGAGIENAVLLDPATQGHELIGILDFKPTKKKLIFCPHRENYQSWNLFQKELKERTTTESEFLPKRYYMGKPSLNEAEEAAIKDAEINPRRQALPVFHDGLTAYKRKQEEIANPRPGNIADYFKSGKYQEDIEKFRQGANVRTGFSTLDKYIGGGMYAGLYVLGAVPSLGKTTFALQIADQIAEQRRPVIFVSLEQSRLELVTKSIARISRKNNPGNQNRILNNLQIRQGKETELSQEAQQKYLETIAPYMNIIEGNFETDITQIRNAIENYIRVNKTQPILILDYLQILSPAPKTRATDQRMITDQNITALKRISRDFEIPVLAISSFNRMNYLQRVDYESFKETGGIEYTADVLIGMQYAAIDNLQGKDANKDRQTIQTAKAAEMREIKLICLKNRYGKANFDVDFKYYPKYDYFTESKPDARKTMFDGVTVH